MHVVFMPGVVMPASLAYAALLEALGDRARPVVKELELYRDDSPPPDYDLELEVSGILAAADRAGFDRFHLVGYSGGGAASLALAAAHPERLFSLALMEPAWAGWQGLGPQEEAVWAEFGRIAELPTEGQMAEFMRLQLAPGVAPPQPPEGPPPPWMAQRPAGIQALLAAFRAGDIDPARLAAFEQPVYYALGGRSNPDYFARQAERLAGLFADFELELYEERHHFDPPHRAEPARVAAALERLWARATPA